MEFIISYAVIAIVVAAVIGVMFSNGYDVPTTSDLVLACVFWPLSVVFMSANLIATAIRDFKKEDV